MRIIAVSSLSYLLVVMLINTVPSTAEQIKFKNGEIIEAEIIEENLDFITVKNNYGTIKIDKKQIVLEKNQIVSAGEKEVVLSPVKVKELPDEEKVAGSIELQSMYRWLVSRIHPKTLLVESFHPTADSQLQKQGATYDEALAGLAFLLVGDNERAAAIIDFYKERWRGNGFSNFYFVPSGESGLESTIHLGPNMWLVLLALHYDRICGQDTYLDFAIEMVEWARSLNHYRGGVAMSNKDEWRAPWTKVVSTENNVDYYAVLNILMPRIKDLQLRKKLKKEQAGVKDFLTNTVYDKQTGGFFRGYHLGIRDRQRALDTVTWLVAAVGIEELALWGINPQRLLQFVEKRFLVNDKGIKGFDFTDKRGAAKAKRIRMVSLEWTGGVINMYCIYSNYYHRLAKKYQGTEQGSLFLHKARICKNKVKFYLAEMDKKQILFGDNRDLTSYPYATRAKLLVFSDSVWWRTPSAGSDGTPAGSVASTAWRMFAARFNPLSGAGKLE